MLSMPAMLTRSLALAALVVAAPLAAPTTARACSCIGYDHDGAVAAFEVAFRGRVRSVTARADGSAIVVLDVLRRWRGVEASERTVTLTRAALASFCPVPDLRVRGTFDVYARREGGEVTVGACNPSRPAARRSVP